MQREEEQIVPSEMTLEKLYLSKKYVRGSVTFQEPMHYVQPVIDMIPAEAINTTRITIETASPLENKNDDGSSNIAYGRVSVTCTIDIGEQLSFTFGVVYGLDMQRPLIKTFVGTEVRTCTNMCIFNADHIAVACLLDDFSMVYKQIAPLVTNYAEIFREHLEVIKRMTERMVTKSEIHTMLGELLEATLEDKNLGKQNILFAADQLFDKSSRYYCGEECSIWLCYNAFTAYITEKTDILEVPNRTFNLFKYFGEK